MKQMLKDFSNLLLVVLCDYVLSEAEYLLLERPGHVAFSNDTVSVEYQYYSGGNVTAEHLSILLLDASTNKIIARKQLPANQSWGRVEFECFHFKSAGDFLFRMVSPSNNSSTAQWNRRNVSTLRVEWPVFHIDLNKSSEVLGSSLQVGLFTNEQLCAMNETVVSLDVIFTSALYEFGRVSSDETLGIRTSKGILLSRSQWVEFDCPPVGQETYITVLLKSLETHSIIASIGPIDLLHKFGYRLVAAPEAICKTLVQVFVVSPPCTSISGKIVVYKEALKHPSQRTTWLYEKILHPGDNRTEFNCTLFDVGKNKYCFDLFNFSNRSYFPTRVKECTMIQRNMAIKPPTPPSVEPGEDQKANNIVTITGISLCLFIIFATVLITLWRKLCRAQKCSTAVRRNSVHSPSFRKNSDEENICQGNKQRDSFAEGGDAPVNIPLTYRRSLQFAQEDDASGSENFQPNAQKIIPPIFSYRLAQQQLKEMKKKGLTETTKVYHVSQNPLTDTVLGATTMLPLSGENQEDVVANKFRIKSPFLDQPASQPKFLGESSHPRLDLPFSQANPAMSPTQTLIRRAHFKHQDIRGDLPERGCHRNPQFRRTASFHETKKARPFRERSMSTLTPRQTPLYNSRTRTWDQGLEDRMRPKSRNANPTCEKLDQPHSTVPGCELQGHGTKCHQRAGPPVKKLDLITDRQPAGQEKAADKPEPSRSKRAPSSNPRSTWRKEMGSAGNDNSQRGLSVSPAQYRRDKCQSFPLDPEFAFYDNTTFGLTETEQQMIDLPGYFGSNEEDETSTLSVEKLVI
ncbi:PREDICTED: thrombospondin type-1 domain-containing protein 1 isoform X2 [Buceros rhinoceros silvestris]|uniref:thrombospondin type-1 domain-containing protein 1 isoform X2 n=1 Tax=Buceros rhinoceros silvestris TaxID=175836 RepID=UPI000528643C|nr:PREDICTED: thrombospondin type-1 domain-containing protein 1 isoform X2 [Buceros rhinoceros silvestris]